MNLKKELQARILDHHEIEERKSKFSQSTAFFAGKKEIAHFHKGNELDVRLTKQEIKKRNWKANPDPRVKQERANSEWVQIGFTKEADLDFVCSLVDAAVKANS